MNIAAFLFSIIGAALNVFQPVISVPASISSFTGSMHDAFIAIINNISMNGLPDKDGGVAATLIFAVLYLVPVIAAVTGLYVLFRKGSRRVGIIFLLCAAVNGLAAYVIGNISSASFLSDFFANYIIPYAQRVSFITPAMWAVFYLIAAIFTLFQPRCPVRVDILKNVSGPSIVFGIGWSDKKNNQCDLDASAFLLDADGKVSSKNDIVYYDDNSKVHKSGAVWSTGDVKQGYAKKDANAQCDLEQIIVLLDEVPKKIKKIVFAVTCDGGNFGDTSSAYARLVDGITVDEEHIIDKTKVVDIDTIDRDNIKKIWLKDNKNDNALVFAGIQRKPEGGWGYEDAKTGNAMTGGLKAICKKFGVNV